MEQYDKCQYPFYYSENLRAVVSRLGNIVAECRNADDAHKIVWALNRFEPFTHRRGT